MNATQTIRPLAFPSDQDASGRTFDETELANLKAVLDSGILTSTKGTFVKAFENAFAELLDVPFAYACTSGTAAIHLAIAAIDPEPGDEIVTTAITDMGALTPILYQGAIPVFADVDPETCNVTAATIARVVSPRTKAIIVTHLFGNPAEIDKIAALAQELGIPLIEDSAQALLASVNGRAAGAIGTIGCFSLQQGKHITTGEGGVVVTSDPKLARRMFLYINKAWGYGDAKPDHYFLALNYRMNELQGAVALAQLQKLRRVVDARQGLAGAFREQIANIPGISSPAVAAHAQHAYWKYAINVDSFVIEGGPVAVGRALGGFGIASAPRYIVKPAFECEIFRKQKTFGTSRWPFTLARPEALDYSRDRFPGTYQALDQVLVLPWNDRYTEEHVTELAERLRQAAAAP